MKVRITHSIDLEDIPSKSADILSPAETELQNAIRWLCNLVEDLKSSKAEPDLALQNINRIRKALGSCDSVLTEVEGIMQGLVEFEQTQNLTSANPVPPVPSVDDLQRAYEADVAERELSDQEKALAEDMLRGLKEKKHESDLPF